MRSQAQGIRMLAQGLVAAPRAATILGLTTPRIYQLLYARRLRGQRIGRTWYVDLRSLRAYLTRDTPPEQLPVTVLGEIDRLLSMQGAEAR